MTASRSSSGGSPGGPIVVATRGSALALAQANTVVRLLRAAWPGREFELKVVRTTGDKLQTASLAQSSAGAGLPKGLFTKELEVELEAGSADLAVHSLKDLPTELPEGLELGAVLPRADARDVLIYRDTRAVAARPGPSEWSPGQKLMRGFGPGLVLSKLPKGAVVATSSTRRAAFVQRIRPDVEVVPIRGNVGTRLQKLVEDASYDATLLAAAGLGRLGLFVGPGSRLGLSPTLPRDHGFVPPPPGLLATVLEPEEMLPAVGQGAIGIEIASGNGRVREVIAALNHGNTWRCVVAERAFLKAVGGGCQSPIAAHARVVGHRVHLRAAVLRDGVWWTGEGWRPMDEGEELGRELAAGQGA